MSSGIANTSRFQTAFLKNKGAVAAVLVIVFCCFLAVFAYFIIQDNSKNANRIILEIGGKRPGYSCNFLLVNKGGSPVPTGFISKLANGVGEQYDYIPIISWQQKNDSFFILKYIDEGIAEPDKFALSQLATQPIKKLTFRLGTDKFGRDILSRIILGTRISLSVGLISFIISLTIGLLLGAIAGYFSGWADNVIMWFVNVVWSIPTLLLVFGITLILGKGFWQVFIAIGLTMWVNIARLVRGQVLAVKQLEYIEAARALGFSHLRIILNHILPNIIGPVLVIAASNFASAIVIEAGLSFLGIGVQPPSPSWGLMIKENYNFIITQNPVIALSSGIAIMLLVLAFNLLGNGLRDALQVKEQV